MTRLIEASYSCFLKTIVIGSQSLTLAAYNLAFPAIGLKEKINKDWPLVQAFAV